MCVKQCTILIMILQYYLIFATIIVLSPAPLIQIRPSSQYDKNTYHALDAMLKCKDKLDFYHCIADALLGTSDRSCHESIMEKNFMIFIQKSVNVYAHGNAAASIHLVN